MIPLLSIRSFLMGALMVGSLSMTGFSPAAGPADYLPSGERHRLFNADMPPGAVGSARLTGRGPIAGYFQPIRFSGPAGVQFSLPEAGVFRQAAPQFEAGLLIGAPYRFRITNIPRQIGAELYPTIEVIDRTYPPPGLATRFPIPINLDQEDLDAALSGKMVTRVIYLEDPQTAMALALEPNSPDAIEVGETQDPLEVADRFGRPVAIVRIGSLTPPTAPQLLPQFFLGYPTWAPVVHPPVATVGDIAPHDHGANENTSTDSAVQP